MKVSDANDLAPSKRRSSSVSSRSNKPSKRPRLPSSSIDPTLDFSLGLSTDETDLLAQMDALTSAHAALGVGAEAGGSQAGVGGGGEGGEEDLGAREAKARSLARATLWGDTLDDGWDLNDQSVIAILAKFEVRSLRRPLSFAPSPRRKVAPDGTLTDFSLSFLVRFLQEDWVLAENYALEPAFKHRLAYLHDVLQHGHGQAQADDVHELAHEHVQEEEGTVDLGGGEHEGGGVHEQGVGLEGDGGGEGGGQGEVYKAEGQEGELDLEHHE